MSLGVISAIVSVMALTLGIAAFSANALVITTLAVGFLAAAGVVIALSLSNQTDFSVQRDKSATVMIFSGTIFATIAGGLGMLHSLA